MKLLIRSFSSSFSYRCFYLLSLYLLSFIQFLTIYDHLSLADSCSSFSQSF